MSGTELKAIKRAVPERNTGAGIHSSQVTTTYGRYSVMVAQRLREIGDEIEHIAGIEGWVETENEDYDYFRRYIAKMTDMLNTAAANDTKRQQLGYDKEKV